MIDNPTISDLVQQEIQQAVDRYVHSVLATQEWQRSIEQQITGYVQDRITAKFQNISSIPDITDAIQRSVSDLFLQGNVPGIDQFIDQQQIKSTIDSAVQVLVASSLESLVNDPAWIEKIQNNIESNVVSRFSDHISYIDVASIVSGEVRKNLDTWKSEFKQDFSSTGIRDMASKCELVITDGAVVAQAGLACDTMLVQQDLTTTNLVVTGTVNTDCASWQELADNVAQKTQVLLGDEWRQRLVEQVLDLARHRGIDFGEITVNGAALVQGNTLNASITETSIQKLGTLREISVTGKAHLAHTMDVANNRVGINTDSPDMALTIWDEEVSLSLGKGSRDHAWIGSNRKQSLDIGVNRQRAITIDPDGLVVIDRLRLDRWRISFSNAVPNHSGTRGDLVINHDPKPTAPFAWQCLGAYQWQPINLK